MNHEISFNYLPLHSSPITYEVFLLEQNVLSSNYVKTIIYSKEYILTVHLIKYHLM